MTTAASELHSTAHAAASLLATPSFNPPSVLLPLETERSQIESTVMTRTSGLLWKMPWRMSQNRKYRQRSRLRAVDTIISTLDISLSAIGLKCKALTRAIDETIPEKQMLSKDKYTLFSRSAQGYRKGVHKVPKFTRVSTPRVGPAGF